MNSAAQVTVTGLVQGVGFRWFVVKRALELDLKGCVRNLDDGNVFVEVEGDRTIIEALIEKLKKGPAFSRVKDVRIQWIQPENRFSNFYIAD